MADNTFLVSVADCWAVNPSTKDLYFYGKANLNSAFTLSMGNTDVRGGINNPLLYRYIHDRDLAVSIEAATFGKDILALNVGSAIVNSSLNVWYTECVQLSDGDGTVTNTPVGNVEVLKADGTKVSVTPSTKTITVSGGADTAVTVFYQYADTVDRITVGTTTPPNIVTLIMQAEVRTSASSSISEYLQIEIPYFQVDGNYELSLTADGVSTEKINGNALSVQGTTCASGDYYAYVSWIPVTSTVSYADIFVTPNVFEPDAGVAATQQLTVMGVRGGSYANVNITSLCTFAKDAAGDADISVNASTGLITVADTSTATDTATITATYGLLTDNCIVTAQTP
jgi:hypothetical protein